jgi:hypothetical protein
MLSVNSAIIALYGYLQADKTPIQAVQKPLWLWAIPAAGAIVSVAWFSLLVSYHKLNRAKFGVLKQLESEFVAAPFTQEQELYKVDKHMSLSQVERCVPGCFFLLYLVLIGANVVK